MYEINQGISLNRMKHMTRFSLLSQKITALIFKFEKITNISNIIINIDVYEMAIM